MFIILYLGLSFVAGVLRYYFINHETFIDLNIEDRNEIEKTTFFELMRVYAAFGIV